MMIKIATILIIGAVLAGSAAAALQATDAALAVTPVSVGCHSRTESATSHGSSVVVVVPRPVRSVAGVGGFTQLAPRIILLTPRVSSAAD